MFPKKSTELNIGTRHFFIDVKAACDRIVRLELWNIMAEFGFIEKLIVLAKLTLANVKYRVRVQSSLSEFFKIMDSLHQGDSQLCTRKGS